MPKKATEKRSGKTRDRIIHLLQKKPTLSVASIAERLEIAARVVERHISKLKSEGVLSRVGEDKGGRWIVSAKTNKVE